MDIEAVAIILVSGFVAVMIIATIGCMIYLIVKASKSGGKAGSTNADETRLIQEIHHGLQRMEKRVESLETLMIDRDGSKESRFDRELRD